MAISLPDYTHFDTSRTQSLRRSYTQKNILNTSAFMSIVKAGPKKSLRSLRRELSSNLENFLFTPTARVTFTLRSCGVYGPPSVRLSLLLNGEWRKGHNARKVPIYQIKSLIAPRARTLLRVSPGSQCCCCCQVLTRHHCQILISRNWPREGTRKKWREG